MLYTVSSLHRIYHTTYTHTHTQAEVIRNKSTETMSFPLTLMSILTTSSWSAYGVLIHDIYVQVSPQSYSGAGIGHVCTDAIDPLIDISLFLSAFFPSCTQFPNFIGLVLSVIQLSLFLFFGGEKKRTISLESPA